METKTGKKIVSRGEYIRGVANKKRMEMEAIGAFCICAPLILLSLCFLGISVKSLITLHWHDAGVSFGLSVMLAGMAYGLYDAGMDIAKKAETIDPGIPLTPANAGYLPVSDTLVRANPEPILVQETVLLRANEVYMRQGRESHIPVRRGKPTKKNKAWFAAFLISWLLGIMCLISAFHLWGWLFGEPFPIKPKHLLWDQYGWLILAGIFAFLTDFCTHPKRGLGYLIYLADGRQRSNY